MDITNTAHVTGDQNDPYESDNDSPIITTVVTSPNQADLLVDKTGSPNPVILRVFLTLTVEVAAPRLTTSTDVTLVDTPSVEVTFSSATSTFGTCSESNGVVTRYIGTLMPDHSANVTIIVIADHVGDVVTSGDEIDFNPDNNTNFIIVSVVDIATEMEIDIRPGSERNPLNLRGRGMLPVAILGATNFDVHDIDVSTVRFGVDRYNARPAHRRRGHLGDVDGIDEMVLQFNSWGLGIERSVECGDVVTLILTGEPEDGTIFDGEDTVNIVVKAT